MGTLLCCTACRKEMVLERVHAGRVVPCPWCRARNDVPQQLDFAAAAAAGFRDKSAGGVLLTFAVITLLGTCFIGVIGGPIIWWIAQGRIHRARDEGRPTEPLIHASRTLAIIATVIGAITASIWLLNAF